MGILTVKEDSLTSIADSIRKKTGKNEKIKFPDGFASAIEGIETGGDEPVQAAIEPSDVNFFDYDGTLIASYSEDEAKVLSELPTPPAHDGLTLQGWNYTLDEVKDNADAADIGALYITDDGKTKLEIETKSNSTILTLNFEQTKSAGVLIDWGDGNSGRSNANTGINSITHTYESAGIYEISLLPDDDCSLKLGYSTVKTMISGSSILLRNLYTGKNITMFNAGAFSGCYYLEHISMGQGIRVMGEVFSNCQSLEYITLPRETPSLFVRAFLNCYKIHHISIAPVLGVMRVACNDCHSLKRIVLIGDYSVMSDDNSHFTNCSCLEQVVLKTTEKIQLATNMFKNCVTLRRLKCKADVSVVGGYVLQTSQSIKEIDLSGCTGVPTLTSTNNLPANPYNLTIIVPASLESLWKSTTNWYVFADYIKSV